MDLLNATSPWPWFALAAALVALVLLQHHYVLSRLREHLKQATDATTQRTAEVSGIIAKLLRPSIHVHEGRRQVARRLADMIREAAERPPGEREIVFYGAAALSVLDEAERTDKALQEAIEDYAQALDFAAKQQVKLRRYIRLFTSDEVRERSPKIRAHYIAWLQRQFAELSEDKRYLLADVPRAPQWGANMARVITTTTVMEITGNGKAAVAIKDPEIAAMIKLHASDAVLGHKPRNEPHYYGSAADASDLAQLKLDIEKVVAVSEEADEVKAHPSATGEWENLE